MNNFGALYRYECKKLLSRKIVWISFGLCMAAIVISLAAPLLGDYYIDGEFIDTTYHVYQVDKGYAEALNGREIDQGLMEETIAAYRTIPEAPGRHYTSTEEYQQNARPYSEIFGIIRRMAGMQTAEVMYSWQPDEDDLYAKRLLYLKSAWEDAGLSGGEMDFWRGREAQIKTPYIYQEHSAYDDMFSNYQMVGLILLLVVAICLSGMFSDEHTRKTDQIILCSPLGKTMLYWSKMAAGISFAAVSAFVLFLFTFIMTTVCLRGAGGFSAAFQFIFATNSDPVTCGQAILIAYGNMMFAAIVISVLVMALSELLHSSIATLAVSTGLLITAMIVNVPEQYRVLSQIWDWLPWCYLTPWNVFGNYTISIFGIYLTPWQAVPLLYIVAGVIIAAIGKPVYQRFQVSGR